MFRALAELGPVLLGFDLGHWVLVPRFLESGLNLVFGLMLEFPGLHFLGLMAGLQPAVLSVVADLDRLGALQSLGPARQGYQLRWDLLGGSYWALYWGLHSHPVASLEECYGRVVWAS